MHHYRILENRLDKAMIKYNEAQSIKKTYEQIVKRLKVALSMSCRQYGILFLIYACHMC
jgi:hypothetical protein